MMPEELVKALRDTDFGDTCVYCEHSDMCKTDDCIILQAAAVIEKLQAKQPHWVSVKERLPKEMKMVVTYGKFRVAFGYNILLYDADTEKEVVEWFDYCGNKENVTHWMPLPEPPQEVQE